MKENNRAATAIVSNCNFEEPDLPRAVHREQREKRTEMAMLSLPRAPEEVAAEVLRVAWRNAWPNVGTLLPKHVVKCCEGIPITVQNVPKTSRHCLFPTFMCLGRSHCSSVFPASRCRGLRQPWITTCGVVYGCLLWICIASLCAGLSSWVKMLRPTSPTKMCVLNFSTWQSWNWPGRHRECIASWSSSTRGIRICAAKRFWAAMVGCPRRGAGGTLQEIPASQSMQKVSQLNVLVSTPM